MKRWSLALTILIFVLGAAQGVLVMAAVLAPPDWTLPLLITAISCILLALIAGGVSTWIDYLSGDDPTGPRDFLEFMFAVILITWPADYLQRSYGFNLWLTASAISTVVMPLWWLRASARTRAAGRLRSHEHDAGDDGSETI
jgi:hypothetical protein